MGIKIKTKTKTYIVNKEEFRKVMKILKEKADSRKAFKEDFNK